MDTKVHYWIVQDAVSYVQTSGTSYQRQAVSVLNQLSGDTRPLNTIPLGSTKLGLMVGYAASDTDRFHDLIVGNWAANDYAQWNSDHVTALNHFQNAYVVAPLHWDWGNGYHYWWSSRQDDDARAMTGTVDYCGISVQSKSAVLPRILPFWRNLKSFQSNFFDPTELRDTVFAPVGDLAESYYNYALSTNPMFGGAGSLFTTPLWVGGGNEFWGPKSDWLFGTTLLGPVCHAIGDACVPQHFRPAMGFYHGEWEGTGLTLVQNRSIDINPPMIAAILSQFPFNPWRIWSGGPLAGCLPCGWLISQVAGLGRDRLSATTQMSYTQVFNAAKPFWKDYYLNKGYKVQHQLPGGVGTDGQYYYNLAVAAVVHLFTRFYADLVHQHIYSPNPGLVRPDRMPDYPDIPPDTFPPRKDDPNAPDPVGIRPTPLSDARVLLGRTPLTGARIQDALDAVHRRAPQDIGDSIAQLEQALISEYQARLTVDGHYFDPLATETGVLDPYNISPHFGIGTFRPPSLEECTDAEGLDEYTRQSEAYSYLTHVLRLTKHISIMEVASAGLEEGDLARRFGRQIQACRDLRQSAIRAGAIVIPPYPGTVPEMPEVIEARPDIPADITQGVAPD
jgi:hypothetical protein